MKKESSIDYPVSEGLCPEIWDEVEEGKWIIKPEIKQKALELVDILLAKYHVEAKGVNIVGSICSNQYTDDGDVDIHIQVDRSLSVVEGHEIGHAVKEAVVKAGLDVEDVVVHVEPWRDASH